MYSGALGQASADLVRVERLYLHAGPSASENVVIVQGSGNTAPCSSLQSLRVILVIRQTTLQASLEPLDHHKPIPFPTNQAHLHSG